MKHNMKLLRQPFEMILNGKKRVEIRLYDEKRKMLELGDEIEFTLLYDCVNERRSFIAKIEGLYRFDGFEELFNSELYGLTGSDEKTSEEFKNSMRLYYSEEKEKSYGVLAIKIKLTD